MIKNNFINVTFKLIVNLYIIVADIQVIIMIIFFFNPQIRDFSLGLLNISDLAQETMGLTSQFRLFGFGAFGAPMGMIFAFILVLISIVLKKYILTFKEILFYFISYFFILLIGMISSRSTAVGLIISFFVFLSYKKYSVKINFLYNRLLYMIIAVFVLIIIFSFCLNMLHMKDIEKYTNFGYRLLEKKEFMRNLHLYFGLQKFPDSLKTWIIGDGLWADPSNPTMSYYAGTDAGYSRMIYYFGLAGLVFFIFVNYYIIRFSTEKNKLFFYSIMLLFIIMNLKQYQSYIALVYPFAFIHSCKLKRLSTGM
jgi:hypothetical protein